MKSVVVGLGGLCACGAWYMSDGPDFDRVVKKAPMEVYAAFSRLAQEGIVTPPDQRGPGPRISFKVEKSRGQTIHYEIRFNDRPVVEADLTFAPSGEGGRETRMTAELDIDAFELGSAYQTEAGVALSLVPDRFVDAQFARFMEHMVRDIEAGRPLAPLGTSGMRHPPGAREPARGGPRFQAQPGTREAARRLPADEQRPADGRSEPGRRPLSRRPARGRQLER